MSRRRTSSLDALVDLSAMLPWWGGLVLAGVSFAGFHWLSQLKGAPGATGQGVVVYAMVASLSIVLKWVVPFAFCAGAVLSAVRTARARRLREQALPRLDAELTDGLHWRDFETLVGEGFRRRGYSVVENHRSGPDGGIDLVLSKDGERGLVQCKHWRASTVGVEVVRELYGVMSARGAAAGFVVTSGTFTTAAREFAEGRNVELIDGAGLRNLLEGARPLPAAAPDQVAESYASTRTPHCPKCQSVMVRRTAERGRFAGRPFWGCSRFPDCRGIVNEP